MIKAIIFDFFGVVFLYGERVNEELMRHINKNLKPKYKIGMISNSSGRSISELLSDEQKKIFDIMVFSAEVGVAKPHPEIYEIAAKRLGVLEAECIYVDDDDFRVAGAKNTGMHGIIYKNFNQMKAELEVLLSQK